METKFTAKDLPTTTYTHGEGNDQVTEAKRLELPMSDMLGAVVVGGCYSSDCFRMIGEVQVGNPDEGYSQTVPDEYKKDW